MKFFSVTFIGVLALVVLSAGTDTAYGGYRDRDYSSRGSVLERMEEQLDRQFASVCATLVRFGFSTLPSICESEEPEPEPEPDAPTLTLEASPLSVPVGGTSTLMWESEDTTDCEASEGWAGNKSLDGSEIVIVHATTTYSLTCSGEGGTTTKSITVTAFEDNGPEPTVDHLVISEVLYDVDSSTQGSEGDNEWVEIYNPTDAPVDLMDWRIGESTSTADVISLSSLILMPGEYLLITDATTTADFWNLSQVDVVYLNSAIGNGLANGGDHVALFDAGGNVVDDVSYGSNVDAFSPSVPTVAEGNSIARDPIEIDTDTAADWIEDSTPTPGA